MQLIDTHSHIQSVGLTAGERSTRELWAKAPQITPEKIITGALKNKVLSMICVGCDLEDSKLAVEFASRFPDNCRASIGLHPHEAQHYAGKSDLIKEFADLASEKAVVAIGECGLDYFYEHSPPTAQIEVLREQLVISQQNDLPVIFHVREAFDDFWPIFDEYYNRKPLRGVLHSYTDNANNLALALERGLYIGVNGIATFCKNAEQLEVYKSIPLSNLLLETDAPFLTPVPYRGTVNEPKYLHQIAKFLSELRGETMEDLANATTVNGKKLFSL